MPGRGRVSLRTELIEENEVLEALAPAWWELWRRCPGETPFTSPAWLIPWWLAFAPGRLRTVAVWSCEGLIALAPMWLEEGRLGARLLPLGIGVSDSFDLLIDPNRADEAGAALVAAVATVPVWEMCSLEELPEAASALGPPVPAGCTGDLAPQSASPALDLTGSGDPDDAVPAAKRRKLRMAQNRTARRGGVVEAVGPDGVDAFLHDLAGLHGARWTSRGEGGVLADDGVRRFQAAALPALAGAGLAQLYRLTVGRQVVAAYYGMRHGDRAYAYIGGFDPAFAFESPGTVLVGHAIREASRSGARSFDFLRGQEAYKYEWGAVDRWSRRRSFARTGRDG